MSSTLRIAAVASCSALLLTGVATSAGASETAHTTRAATAANSTVSTTSLTYADTVTVSAGETAVSTGLPVVGQKAVLLHEVLGVKGWHRANGTTVKVTGHRGLVTWKVAPKGNSRYRVHFRQTHLIAGVDTTTEAVRVTPRFHLRSLHTAAQLSTSTIKGSIHPHVTGLVYLQVFKDGAWKPVQSATLSDGHFAFPISPKDLGTLKYRVVRRTDSSHAHGVSPTLKVHVVHRTLSLGDTGPDVLTLQKRLHKLHYDIGPRNGTYGYDTLHAVTAFQKVNGLTKDGETGKQVWSKLNHPKAYHLRHPYTTASLAVEVNLAKQVVVLARNGKVWRILDSSTAGGYLYTGSDGQVERAITPTGHFHIQYKITGWHKSSLGELYYPSYFTDTGYAIHGEGNGNDAGEVPPYANSHGCVRITNDAVLRYYNRLVVGTSVWIYG